LIRAYESAGTPERAIPIFQDLLERKKASLGPDHRDTLDAANKLARQYWITKQLDKSIPTFEDVVQRSEAKFGRKDEFTRMAIGNLGVNHKDAGNLDKAIPLLEEACGTETKTPIFQNLAPQLVVAYVKAGMTEKARETAKKVLDEMHQRLPQESPELAGQLAKLGLLMLKEKAFEQAAPVLRECLVIREKKEPDAWLTFNTQSMLGSALSGQKKFDEAAPLLLKGYEGMKQREKTIPPEGMVRLPEAVDRLIEHYTATNKPDEVKKWRSERIKYPTAPAPPKK
jgi:tetratricopeptide (TPR) repeat protein